MNLHIKAVILHVFSFNYVSLEKLFNEQLLSILGGKFTVSGFAALVFIYVIHFVLG